jgi:hypothetical protein
MTNQEPCSRWANEGSTVWPPHVRVNGGAPELGSSEASCCVADPDVRVVISGGSHQAFPKAGTVHGTTR